ncbi:MAG: preprotein translocase subunit SecG [Alphaproteobacteria bacterium]|nr:preprotein translocase subunit SecG [Alphaproteobacteria bacterium]
MQTVLVVIQVLLAVALVGVVLMQRSEGGGLGMGQGGMGGFLSGRGQANMLTQLTAGIAALFMVTSLVLALVARDASRPASILEGVDATETQTTTEGEAPAEDSTAEPTVPLAE